MKKLILSAAIAATVSAPVAALADNTVYGQFRYSFGSIDDANIGADGLQGNDNVSRLGIKGSTSGDGLKAFYHLQMSASADGAGGAALGKRFYFAGLKGGMGKVAYGRMSTAYKMPGVRIDPFYDTTRVNVSGAIANGGASFGSSPLSNGFTNNALQYSSPAIAGITFNAGLYVDDSNEDDHGTGLGLTWKSKKLTVGVQAAFSAKTAKTIANLSADSSALRVHAGYKSKSWSLGASYEMVENVGATDAVAGPPVVAATPGVDANYLIIAGTAKVGSSTKLAASFGMVDPDAGAGAPEGTSVTVGVFQTVLPKTEVYASFSTASLDSAPEDPSSIVVGAIHKF